MNKNDPSVEDDPTIMGNEKPRRNLDDDSLPDGEKVQEEDPRNGMNRPLDESGSDRSEDERDEP
jgi:hypothetical protein